MTEPVDMEKVQEELSKVKGELKELKLASTLVLLYWVLMLETSRGAVTGGDNAIAMEAVNRCNEQMAKLARLIKEA